MANQRCVLNEIAPDCKKLNSRVADVRDRGTKLRKTLDIPPVTSQATRNSSEGPPEILARLNRHQPVRHLANEVSRCKSFHVPAINAVQQDRTWGDQKQDGPQSGR